VWRFAPPYHHTRQTILMSAVYDRTKEPHALSGTREALLDALGVRENCKLLIGKFKVRPETLNLRAITKRTGHV
jgi:hypothetical protein